MAPPNLITTTEAGRRAGVTPAYVRYLALTGRIPHTRIGRMICVTPQDLDAWNEERRARRRRRLTVQMGGREQ